MKVIISGGGTGGHIFPAISIANAIMKSHPKTEILFVGAQGKMEMDKVPAAGYEIVGLPVAGFQRRLTLKNITFFYKLAASMLKARKVVKEYNPDVVVGVGGYASGPVLRVASKLGVPTLIQEQNSFPGVTNRILSSKVNKICVAYPRMDRFFPKDKVMLTGNPVRQNLIQNIDRQVASDYFGLDLNKQIIFVTGGSLGARTINDSLLVGLNEMKSSGVQFIWQTGKLYYNKVLEVVGNDDAQIKVFAFIDKMELAFALADVVIARAGASSISEIALLEKATVFVPSPNVSEDHQTKNANALVTEGAAIMVKDVDAKDKLLSEAISLVKDEARRDAFKVNIKKFACPDAAQIIAHEVVKLVK